MLTVEGLRKIERRILESHDSLSKTQEELIMELNNERTKLRMRSYCYDDRTNDKLLELGYSAEYKSIIMGELGDFVVENRKRRYLNKEEKTKIERNNRICTQKNN